MSLSKAGIAVILGNKTPSIKSTKAIYVAPTIWLWELRISTESYDSADNYNTLPHNTFQFLKDLKINVQRVLEQGDDLIRLTGEFTITKAQVYGHLNISIAKPIDKIPSNCVSPAASAGNIPSKKTEISDSDPKIDIKNNEEIEAVMKGKDAEKSKKEAEEKAKVIFEKYIHNQPGALNFQEHVESTCKRYQNFALPDNFYIQQVLNSKGMKQPLALGPKAVLCNDGTRDVSIAGDPKSSHIHWQGILMLSGPGKDVMLASLTPGVSMTINSVKAEIRVIQDVQTNKDIETVTSRKRSFGYLSEINSQQDAHILSKGSLNIADTQALANRLIVIDALDPIEISQDHTTLWSNKAHCRTFQASYQSKVRSNNAASTTAAGTLDTAAASAAIETSTLSTAVAANATSTSSVASGSAMPGISIAPATSAAATSSIDSSKSTSKILNPKKAKK